MFIDKLKREFIQNYYIIEEDMFAVASYRVIIKPIN